MNHGDARSPPCLSVLPVVKSAYGPRKAESRPTRCAASFGAQRALRVALGRIPRIHRQHLAGDVAAAVAEQESGHARDVLRLRQAPQRASTGDLLAPLVAEAGGELGLDEARGDRVDRD